MGSFCVQKHPTNLTNHRNLEGYRRNDTLPFPGNIPPITIQASLSYQLCREILPNMNISLPSYPLDNKITKRVNEWRGRRGMVEIIFQE